MGDTSHTSDSGNCKVVAIPRRPLAWTLRSRTGCASCARLAGMGIRSSSLDIGGLDGYPNPSAVARHQESVELVPG